MEQYCRPERERSIQPVWGLYLDKTTVWYTLLYGFHVPVGRAGRNSSWPQTLRLTPYFSQPASKTKRMLIVVPTVKDTALG